MKVVLGMPFLAFSKVEVDFAETEFIWKTYTIVKTLPITKRVQIIDLKEFAKAALDSKQDAFVVHIATFFNPIEMHLDQKVQIPAFIADEAPIIIPAKYSDFKDVFSKKSATVLLEHTGINIHVIDLEEGNQLFYNPFYSLELVELETPRPLSKPT